MLHAAPANGLNMQGVLSNIAAFFT